MSKILKVETAITTTRLHRNLRLSHGSGLERQRHVIVRLTTEDGVQGFGEASPLTFLTGETVETARFAIDHLLAPTLVGREAINIAALHRHWSRTLPGHNAAKCAIDVALHDLVAREGQMPIAALLGGRDVDVLPAYKAIGIGTPADIANEASELLELGLRRFKLKVGRNLQQDLENLRVLRDTVGERSEIIVDGNGGYTAQQAVRFLRLAEPFNVAYIEQPVLPGDIAGLAFVRAHAITPVMADEAVFTLRDVYQLIRQDAVDLLGIKLIKTAGLYHARRIAALAEEFGIGCVVISPFETELGVAASVHMAASLSQLGQSHGLGSFLAATEGRDTQLDARSGGIAVPTGPGLGITPPSSWFSPRATDASIAPSDTDQKDVGTQ